MYYAHQKVDLGDQGDVVLYGEWARKEVWEGPARAYVMNEWAEKEGVPHGSVMEGILVIAPFDPEEVEDILDAEWEWWEFSKVEKIEVSQELVDSLAEAAQEILIEQGWSKEDLIDEGKAEFVWGRAWKRVEEMWSWADMNKMLQRVTPGEVEALAYEKISA